jgi:RNA polymerase sigma-70 factor (ECF subfamily)
VLPSVEVTIDGVYRAHWPLLVASLARWTGDLDRAEEAAADAVAAACASWPTDGVPREPAAWLQTTARRRVLDRLRRDAVARDRLTVLAQDLRDAPAADSSVEADDPFVAVAWSDEAAEDLLRLVFTCCHPALAPTAQVPLALRLLCGLTAGETARLLQTSEPTVAQRLVRAKRKIRDTGIGLAVPPRSSWPERLEAVLAVVGLVFTEGHAATEGTTLVRSSLCDEALRLAALLHRLLPDEPEVLGLRALLLLTDARRDARVADGWLVLLDDQDRSTWRWTDVDAGLDLVTRALRRAGPRPGRWLLQACIAASTVAPEPDREAVVALYDALLRCSPSPAVRVNRAAAVARAQGPAAGLAELGDQPLGPSEDRALVLRAELHLELGERDTGRELLVRAAALARNDVVRQHLERRLTEVAPDSTARP